MNAVDVLLNNDAAISNIKKDVKINRLSDFAGSDVVFKVRAISYDEYVKILREDDNANVKLKVCSVAVVDPNLNNKSLQMKYSAVDSEDLVDKMLLMGEISMLYDEICNISGFNDETSKIVTIKN